MEGRPERRSAVANSAASFPRCRVSLYRRQRDMRTLATAERNCKRYLALARKASSSGDIVETENFYQHAEHYFRVMAASDATKA